MLPRRLLGTVLSVGVLACAPSVSSEAPEAPRPFDEDAVAEPDVPVTPCDGTLREALGRPYCVKAPTTDDGPAPVLVLLHGFGGNGERQARYFGFDDLPDRRGFVLVKPNGLFASGSRFRAWNAFSSCCSGGSDAPDDVAYLDAVLADVGSAVRVDPKRVFFVGHSNGAFMAQRYACDRSERVAAVVSLAGAVDPARCEPSAPVAFVEVHGTTDRIIKWSGGRTVRAKVEYPGVEATLAFWARENGCGNARASLGTNDLVTELWNEPETTVERYPDCRADVELWRLNGTGHVPRLRKPAWSDAVASFLLAHPKP